MSLLDEPQTTTTEDAGLVGERLLHAVQTIAIGRLTSHVTPIVPGTFVAVTGQGPAGDSNGSGKTTFLGAVSLLLGDPQWQLTAGGALAAKSLFDPDPAGAHATRHPAYEHGYIVGLFALEDGTDPLTVWIRLNASSPYLKVRTAADVTFALGDTQAQREAAGDAAWAALGIRGELGVAFPATLYGPTPRCIAWLESRGGKEPARQSLLSASLQSFKAEEIGDELVLLAGRSTAADEDTNQRRQFFELTERREQRRHDNEADTRREDHDLEGIKLRNQARQMVGEATRRWRLHYAAGLLERVAKKEANEARRGELASEREALDLEREQARAQVTELSNLDQVRRQYDEAEAAWTNSKNLTGDQRDKRRDAEKVLRDAEARRDELAVTAQFWDRRPAATYRAVHEEAVSADRAAEIVVHNAKLDITATRGQLEAARSGEGGTAGALVADLREVGVAAVALLDATTVEDDARNVWEPLLALYSEAVVVDGAQIDAALGAAAPGSVLISASSDELPPGIAEAPPTACGFLASLLDRHGLSDEPVAHTIDTHVGVRVVGGFEAAIAGRDARIAAAQRDLDDAIEFAALAETERAATEAALIEAAARLAEAEAGEELVGLLETIPGLSENFAAADGLFVSALAAEAVALAKRDEAKGAFEHHEANLEAARTHLNVVESNLHAVKTEAAELDAANDRLNMDYWLTWWGRPAEAAATDIAAYITEQKLRQPPDEGTLRKAATEAIAEALGVLGFLEPDAAPTPRLTAALQQRRDQNLSNLPQTTDAVLTSLREWLDEHEELDQSTAERIVESRLARSQELVVLDEMSGAAAHALQVIQDGIRRSVETRLEAVSEQLDRLNRAAGGFGAELSIEVFPPEGAAGRWRFEVEPRWRRSPGSRMLGYKTTTNSAQAKLFSVHLVVGALFASGAARGRALILDELGNSLGENHRREVLKALADVAAAEGITVFGTCQNDLLAKAGEVCGQTIIFERRSNVDVLNAATRFFGANPNPGAVELVADAVRAGRPVA